METLYGEYTVSDLSGMGGDELRAMPYAELVALWEAAQREGTPKQAARAGYYVGLRDGQDDGGSAGGRGEAPAVGDAISYQSAAVAALVEMSGESWLDVSARVQAISSGRGCDFGTAIYEALGEYHGRRHGLQVI